MDFCPPTTLKREPTYGLITPDVSMTSSGIVHPKEEELDPVSFSDKLQGRVQQHPSLRSHHDLYSEAESFDYEIAERQRRSASVSIRSSYPPLQPPHRIHNIRRNPFVRPATMASTPIENGIGLETAARNIKELVDTLEQLRHIGLKSIETHLPELIMVGDQSAGKSSMMSAIAEINLPRGHSMCTRCPTNIKTSDAPVWSCKIELHEQYTWDPVVRKRTQKFQNWVEREEGLVVKDFASVKHKRDLEEVLKWAQLALLNPSEDCGSFIPGTDGHARQRQKRKDNPNHKEQAKFSPNVISIEILGPNLPPLSFYDLPGLFQDAEDADQEYLIKVFEDLTVKYIKHEKALIICAINMAIDPGLSRTKNVITAKKAKDRCIGVLTMPDRLQQHETVHKDYDNIFHKRTYVLPHGYFVTKQPGPEFGHHDDPDYHIIARQEEEEFFDSGSFWSKGREWEEFRSRCGTGTILKYLSEEFAKLILSSLPDIEQKVKEESEETERELALIPEIASDKVQHIVRRELDTFSTEAASVLNGNPEFQSHVFHSDWKRLCHQFQKALEAMRPGCYCGHPLDRQRTVINLVEDSDDDTGASFASSPGLQSGKRKTQHAPLGPAKRPKIEASVKAENHPGAMSPPLRTPTPKPKPVDGPSKLFVKLKGEGLGPFYQPYLDSGHKAMSLQDIEKAIHDHSLFGRPEHFNHKVTEEYALTSISAWKDPLKTFLDHTFAMLRREIHEVLARVLKNHKDTELYKRSVRIVDSFLHHHEVIQREKSEKLLEMEKAALFTINDQEFARHKEDALDCLRVARRKIRVAAYVDSLPRPNGKERDRDELMNKVQDKDLPRDRFWRELDAAAYIRGYYTTARLRFTDSVCANINVSLFQAVKKGLKFMLETQLRLDDGGEALCQELLSGNAALIQRRNLLLRKKEKLSESSLVLDRLRRSPTLREDFSYDNDGFNELEIEPRYEGSSDIDDVSPRGSFDATPNPKPRVVDSPLPIEIDGSVEDGGI